MPIKVLDKHVAELIAAGEVVERPSSVIKELCENSIDAGATTVTVEIKNGGISYMRITDNGCGIPFDEVPLAFVRHATSKVSTESDLTRIGTLGFRGEALASVASVARVDMLTATADGSGTAYSICGGEETAHTESGCPKGTTIIVRDLFFNTPARMKFLKKDTSEGNSVAGVVDRMALSHPEVSFRFIRDGRQVLLTPGKGGLEAAVYAVYGRDFSSGLMPVEYGAQGCSMSGLICRPVAARKSRSMQHFFINGRYVKSKTMRAALEQAYKGSIMVGCFPSCVIRLDMPFDQVDINVHPAKIECRFVNEKQVFDIVYYGVKNALQKGDTRSEIKLGDTRARANITRAPLPESEQIGLHNTMGAGVPSVRGAYSESASLRVGTANGAEMAKGTASASGAGSVGAAGTANSAVSANGASSAGAAGTANSAAPANSAAAPASAAFGTDDFAQSGAANQSSAAAALSAPASASVPDAGAPAAQASAAFGTDNFAQSGAAAASANASAARQTYAPERAYAPNADSGALCSADSGANVADGSNGYGRRRFTSLDIIVDDEVPATHIDNVENPVETVETPQNADNAPAVEAVENPPAVAVDKVDIKLIGEAFRTYAIAECGDELIIIDKHAAHERILYEQLKAGEHSDPQMLLSPVAVTLSKDEYTAVCEHIDEIERAGFEIEDFGSGCVLVRAVPSALEDCGIESLITEIAAGYLEHKSGVGVDRLDWLYHNMACRAAVKGGDHSGDDLLVLAKRLLLSDDIRYCPHGRPVAFRLTRKELEKQFGRQG